jgi:hypothetical protein
MKLWNLRLQIFHEELQPHNFVCCFLQQFLMHNARTKKHCFAFRHVTGLKLDAQRLLRGALDLQPFHWLLTR